MNAKEYRNLKKQTLKLYPVHCKSGAVFQCSKPDLSMYFTSGKLPNFYKNQLIIAKMAEKLNDAEIAEKLAEDEELQKKVLDNALFARDLILRHVNSPKLVENPINDAELGFDELNKLDFEDLLKWLLSGGESGLTAQNFRS